MARKAASSTISDLGEKIGGARKDKAVKKGPRVDKGPVDTRPGWQRRFTISEIAKSMRPEEQGKFAIYDVRTKDQRGQPRPATRTLFASQAEAERAVPLLAVSQKHYVRETYGRTADGKIDHATSNYEIWRKVSDKKQVKAVPTAFPTKDAAMAHMASNANVLLGGSGSFGEEIKVKPAKVYREGPKLRTSDVDPKQFLNEFKFRGVEFGNWQGDRQVVVNHAYDAMHDLAQITKISADGLTFNDRLGLAFGARGHGGKKAAAAHYEPDKVAINLTKLSGAGTLAHEWWHGMDHYLGRVDTKSGETPSLARSDIYASHRANTKA